MKEPAGEKWRDHLPCGQLKEKKQISVKKSKWAASELQIFKDSHMHSHTQQDSSSVAVGFSKNYFHNNRIKNNTAQDPCSSGSIDRQNVPTHWSFTPVRKQTNSRASKTINNLKKKTNTNKRQQSNTTTFTNDDLHPRKQRRPPFFFYSGRPLLSGPSSGRKGNLTLVTGWAAV